MGTAHINVAAAVHQHANVLMALRMFEEARKQFSKALNMRRVIYENKDHLEIVTTLADLAACEVELGDIPQAERMWEEQESSIGRMIKTCEESSRQQRELTLRNSLLALLHARRKIREKDSEEHTAISARILEAKKDLNNCQSRINAKEEVPTYKSNPSRAALQTTSTGQSTIKTSVLGDQAAKFVTEARKIVRACAKLMTKLEGDQINTLYATTSAQLEKILEDSTAVTWLSESEEQQYSLLVDFSNTVNSLILQKNRTSDDKRAKSTADDLFALCDNLRKELNKCGLIVIDEN